MVDTERYPLSCGSYRAGHDVHHIQMRQVVRHPHSRRDGVVTAIGGHTVVVLLDDGEVCRFLNHDTGWIDHLLDRYGARVAYHPRWGVLAFPTGSGEAHVSATRSGELGPCGDRAGGVAVRPGEASDPASVKRALREAILGLRPPDRPTSDPSSDGPDGR